MQRVIVLADGKADRWTLSTPKHLMVLGGEVIFHRTVRQLFARGVRDVVVTSHDSRMDLAGVTRYVPQDNIYQIDQFYACRDLWLKSTTPIVFLYGDVRFSDAAMDTILCHSTRDYTYFQRTRGSQITGKPWKEGFAMKVANIGLLRAACEAIRAEIVAGRQVDRHHQLQGYLEGRGTGVYFEREIGPHGVEINDETDDLDIPEDVERWERSVAAWRQTCGDAASGSSEI